MVRARAGGTILHLSDTQFGSRHRFGDGGPGSLGDRLLQALAGYADIPRIELVVLSGDITETGKTSEFDEARRFLDRLLTALDLDVEQLVVVPGNHDVNWDLCKAYFFAQMGAEREPVEPYAQKWGPYEQFVQDLHGATAFTPDQPFTVRYVEDLGLAVAALNSTIKESHVDHLGWCGEEQLRLAAQELGAASGWLRLAVVHHNVRRQEGVDDHYLHDGHWFATLLEPCVDLVLHGHTHDGKHDRLPNGTLVLSTGSAGVELAARPEEVPNQCQVVDIRPDVVTRWPLRYQPQPGGGRWIADTALSQTGRDWRVEFPLAGPVRDSSASASGRYVVPRGGARVDPGFLMNVEAVTRLRDGVDHVALRESFDFDYLAVFGSGEMRAVGVVDMPVTDELLEQFCVQVHAPISSRGGNVRSELVHTGASDPGVRRRATRRGVHVRSWAEYQNLLDLSAYRDDLRRRLTNDSLYPQDLYLEQRYKTIGRDGLAVEPTLDQLAETVLDDLLAEGSRFVLVLGDPGYGKSFLMRRVTHMLLSGESGITPIVIVLREAEKRHDLEEIVAPALASTATAFKSDRFRRMFRGGRVVMLIDGYDEFAVRVGYGRAADQLRTFLRAVDDEAKIVLTTRPNHFRSRHDVTSQVFEDVLTLDAATRRIYELEPFNRQQQTAFLTRWFHLSGRPNPDAEARLWMDALSSVDNLPELAQTPRMLSFMAARLRLDQIRAAGEEAGPVTAAGLYELLVDVWLATETEKFGDQTASSSAGLLDSTDRWRVAKDLAFRLWLNNDVYVTETLLEEVAAGSLDLPRLGLTVAQAAQEIGSRTLLVGDGDHRYFAHQSIGEFLLACQLADLLRANIDPDAMGQGPISELTARFLCDLAPRDGTRWLRRVAQEAP